MKHSLLIFLFMLALSATHSASALPETGHYALDSSHTYVGFSADHMGYSRISGRFNQIEGRINVNSAGMSKLDVTIKTASIDTNHAKRDDHLRSPDFFNTKQFPTITFSSPLTLTDGSDGKVLVGEIEILGVRKPVSLSLVAGKEGKDPWGLYRIGYSARGVIKRSDFGMDFMAGGIGDNIDLQIYVEAVKQ